MMNRIGAHPILPPLQRRKVVFFFRGREYRGMEGEPITSALIAKGIHVFGRHPKDDAPQGIFCANGQCSQCMVLVDGVPVKGCMTVLKEGMRVEPCIGKPVLPEADGVPGRYEDIEVMDVPYLIIGGGPAGLSAAAELGRRGLHGLLVDDRNAPGGKLCLQTHKFFGSRDDCYAGMRGIDIAGILEKEIEETGQVEIWRNSPALGVFSDKKVGILKNGREYVLIRPQVLLVAAGARERSLAFPGSDLPGVMGAGAFQTLVNRDRVLPGKRLFVIGGGNVGLIVAYHAIQAGMEVVGLAEYMEECGGYLVHEEKILRLGVPIYTGHTVLGAEGAEHVSAVTIAAVDEKGSVTTGTEKRFDIDTLLVAVGLSPVDELYMSAAAYGMKVYAAGDAEEISEAGAAMFSGRIRGRQIAGELGAETSEKAGWDGLMEVLKSRPGERRITETQPPASDIYPVIRCYQEIPCNPCTEVCPLDALRIEGDALTGIPSFRGDRCTGCGKCVLVCPGLAITLVNERGHGETARVTIPWELGTGDLDIGMTVQTVDHAGRSTGRGTVTAVKKGNDRCKLVTVEVPFERRLDTASILPPSLVRAPGEAQENPSSGTASDNTIVCRCERVTRGEIVSLIRQGYRDMNSLKAALRTGMGACGGKTCSDLIRRLFREEGVPLEEVTDFSKRPPLQEVSLGRFAGIGTGGDTTPSGDGGNHG